MFTGDHVTTVAGWKWQLYFGISGDQLIPSPHDDSLQLSYYGVAGLTALLGVQINGNHL